MSHTRRGALTSNIHLFFFCSLFFLYLYTDFQGSKYHIKHWEEFVIKPFAKDQWFLKKFKGKFAELLWGNYDVKSSSDFLCLSSSIVNKFETTFTIHFRLVNMLLSVSISKQSRTNTGMLFEIRFVNAPLTWNNFLSRAADFYNSSCNFHVKELFSSQWGNMREGMGAEVLEPAAFGTSVLPKISPYSRPFLLHVPFNTVPPQPSISRSIWTVTLYTGYFDWVCCTSSMSIYI